ncbi:MAG TPA: UPF0149 family protein [Moraxellaceae bacterium]|nr:UPF0149 family protein [Moraxellaceae bacterium]
MTLQSVLDLDPELEARLDEPLTEDELMELDNALIELGDRFDQGREEPADCVGDIAELDGFLLAVASSPRMLGPEEWVPAVWGGERPPFASPDEEARVLGLLLRHYNSTEQVLLDDPDTFDPLFAYEEDEQGDEVESVDEWCAGFLRGLELAWDAWEPVVEQQPDLFRIIQLFGTEEGWEEQASYQEAEIEALQDGLPELARTLFTLGMEARAATPTIRRNEPKVGRNDPCPCGSGKKFKQCCGA